MNVPKRRGATGDDPESWRRRTASRYPDDPGRVVQTAAKLVLEPIFEADLDPAAHGYRPGRGAGQAIQTVLSLLRQGYTDVVDADLSKYFDTIPHDELMQSLARRIVDPDMLRLIKRWLSNCARSSSLNGISTISRDAAIVVNQSKGSPQTYNISGPPGNRAQPVGFMELVY